MEIGTAWTFRMKWIVHQDIQMESTVQRTNLSAITIYVFVKMISVMELMIVMTDRTKRKNYAVSIVENKLHE